MQILTLCGSLRACSSNRVMLRAYAALAPGDWDFEHYERLGGLPHFNPDADGDGADMHDEVSWLRRAVARADAVVISTPEYAHALPGAFKNALDWLVSDPAFAGKPVVIVHADRGSAWALDSLREVLRTMSAAIIDEATVLLPLGSNQVEEATVLANAELRGRLARSLDALARALSGAK